MYGSSLKSAQHNELNFNFMLSKTNPESIPRIYTWVVDHRCLPFTLVVGVLDFLANGITWCKASEWTSKIVQVQQNSHTFCFHGPL
jgi:hypothetical protein